MKPFVCMPLLMSLLSLPAQAEAVQFDDYMNKPYSAVRLALLADGWKMVKNQDIENTSFYAHSIFDQGYKEVLDCISMERDQCQFVLRKDQQLIIVTTKEKALNVESIESKQ